MPILLVTHLMSVKDGLEFSFKDIASELETKKADDEEEEASSDAESDESE